MKGTRHNGRSGKNGVYNPLHNDRRFNPEHSEHIDNERVRQNIYWDCYQGYTTMEDQGKENYFSFEQIELAFYDEHYGIYVMKFFCPFYWLLGFLHVMAGTVRGTGKTFQTMVVFLVSLCVCRVIWIWAVLRIDHKLSYVMTAYPVTWLIGAVLIALYVWKGKWMPEAYYRMKKEG